MVAKYTRLLEEHAINAKTGEIWTIYNVPNTWRKKTEEKVISDGYVFNEEGIPVRVESED